MLLAQANLHKLTLIGPPGGIPGIFYGPYWIWLLSLPMLITRDPKFITLLAITIPYLFFSPLILWKMRRHFGLVTIFILWTLFITNFDNYVTFPWSPYLVALFILLLAYLIVQKKPAFLVGMICALTPNFNFSFGLTVILATTVFQLFTNLRKFPFFLTGVILVYLPFLFFEFRHNFLQIHAFLDTFLKSALFNTSVVGQIGMPKTEIFPHLFAVATGILHLPVTIFPLVGITFLVLFFIKDLFKDRLAIFLLCCLGSLLAMYFLTKNPVWPYYFIGTETIFLLLLGKILSKSAILRIILGFFAFFLLITTLISFFRELRPKYLTIPSLASKESITRFIIADSNASPFTVFAYSPAIYTFDYDYLFSWLGVKKDPDAKNTYLIIPPTTPAIYLDFINYKTPEKTYQTVFEKIMPDGTTVIKRTRII